MLWYQMFRLRVKCTCCFIKQKYRRVTYHGSGNSYSLFLTTCHIQCIILADYVPGTVLPHNWYDSAINTKLKNHICNTSDSISEYKQWRAVFTSKRSWYRRAEVLSLQPVCHTGPSLQWWTHVHWTAPRHCVAGPCHTSRLASRTLYCLSMTVRTKPAPVQPELSAMHSIHTTQRPHTQQCSWYQRSVSQARTKTCNNTVLHWVREHLNKQLLK